MRIKCFGSVLLSILFITSLAASLPIAILTSSSTVSAASDSFIKDNMPDLGQHSKNWCWVASAADSMYWFSQHGYLQLIDDPDNATPNDNTYITTMIPHPPTPISPLPDNVYRLLQEIAIESLFLGSPEPVENSKTILDTWDNGILDNQYFSGLQEFIDEQGAQLTVHEIVDNNSLASVPPQNDNIVVYRPPTLRDYKSELASDNYQVLLWLNYQHHITDNYPYRYETTDHVVTGVGFGTDNTWILVSDPWTTGAPDHNNALDNRNYDNLPVLSAENAPLMVLYAGVPVPVSALIYISPTAPSAPVDNFKRDNMPDLGQHCDNWCWAAAAANVFKWYYHNGYPNLMDDPENSVPNDNNYLQLLPPAPTDPIHDNVLRLLHEIAKDCLYPNVAENNENVLVPWPITFCNPIDDNRYFYGLQKFIREQGVSLKVSEIIDNDHFVGLPENIPPENDGVVVYAKPTFDNYKNGLKAGNVLLQIPFRNTDYEPPYATEALDHIVTGVSYYDGGPGNQWIQVSDSWTPFPNINLGPDHNNEENRYTYENLAVMNVNPLTVAYTGWSGGNPQPVIVQVVKLIFISPGGAGASVGLSVGWNHVEFTAVDNTKDTPTNVFPGLNYLSDFIVYWYKVGAGYQLQGASTAFNDNTAYWVYINTNKTVTTSGTRPPTHDIVCSVGWNMVGFPIDNSSTTPTNVFPGLNYLSDFIVYWYKVGAGYQLQGAGAPLKDNTGYWVYINTTKTVTVPA